MIDTAQASFLFRAFSDPTRLRILILLQEGELCVGDLTSILKVPQPTVSRHLSYLRRTGLITGRQKGYWSFYSLSPKRNVLQKRLLDCLGGCLEIFKGIQKDKARAARIRAVGGCCPK